MPLRKSTINCPLLEANEARNGLMLGLALRAETDPHFYGSERIADGYLYFWENGQPVSMAGLTRPTARGITIGAVYTPPDQRGHGYASSAVARLSQAMLDAGKEFCALFTNLANPTSNHIYQQIGYRALVDFTLYRFV